MTDIDYTPDEDIKVHSSGAIELLCRGFQSHENGLPEWVKNSADAYVRERTPQDKRFIVLLFRNGGSGSPPKIGCLDFVGMTTHDIEEYFRHWADPDAAKQGQEEEFLQGGHGNGGKCYMTQMFQDFSLLYTVRGDTGNLYGVPGEEVRFGYVPDRNHGRNFRVESLGDELGNALSNFDLDIEDLPAAARQAASQAKGFTLVSGINPKGYEKDIPALDLLEHLKSHAQMIRSLTHCQVQAVIDGSVHNGGRPLSLPEIEPLPQAEGPHDIPIPETLTDPRTGRDLSTTQDGNIPQGELTLKTSAVSMRYSKKWRHNIIFKTNTGFVGVVDMPDIHKSYYADRMYGDCYLPILDEYTQNDRRQLADAPVTRALKEWIREQVEEYAGHFQKIEERKIDQEERDALSQMNAALDNWKNQFLDRLSGGFGGGPGSGGGPSENGTKYADGTANRILLTVSQNMLGVGVDVRPKVKYFNANGQRVRPTGHRLVSSDPDIIDPDNDVLTLKGKEPGTAEIRAETLDGRLESNPISLQVVAIESIDILPEEVEVAEGSRSKLDAVCTLGNGEKTRDVSLIWTESDPDIAKVSASGLVFGINKGSCEVGAGDNRCFTSNYAVVRVTQAEDTKGTERGSGYPRILLSEIDEDPDTGEIPQFSAQEPPVHQRVQDVSRNIWWINMATPLARRYLDTAKGYGHKSEEWRVYHLERYVEAMVKIVLSLEHESEREITFDTWMRHWDEMAVEMQENAAESLTEYLDQGSLPSSLPIG